MRCPYAQGLVITGPKNLDQADVEGRSLRKTGACLCARVYMCV